jgi:hypothetical protein
MLAMLPNNKAVIFDRFMYIVDVDLKLIVKI